jgi:hypothetical protein
MIRLKAREATYSNHSAVACLCSKKQTGPVQYQKTAQNRQNEPRIDRGTKPPLRQQQLHDWVATQSSRQRQRVNDKLQNGAQS